MSHKQQALVSLSGGLDSTVSLYWAIKNYENSMAVFFDYGQKALHQERKTSKELCEKLGAEFFEINLDFVSKFSESALNLNDKSLPKSVDLNSEKQTKDSAASVWVPNRNGLFINAASCLLEAKGGGDLILGFNAEEAETFPDNSKEFLEATNRALEFSTQGIVRLFSPTVDMTKEEIYKLGLELAFDPDAVWPCYESSDRPCGVCESCMRFYRAKELVESDQ